MEKLSERKVHDYLFKKNDMEILVVDTPEIEYLLANVDNPINRMLDNEDISTEADFELWRILKNQYIKKILALHEKCKYGKFIGSNIKLPTDKTKPMELDIIGIHEAGLFILELKVNGSAERNAFSELLAYSNYIAEIFPGSSRKDITNILVANLDTKITNNAYLYDLIISDRQTIVYRPIIKNNDLHTLQLHLHIPSDEDFEHFTNTLLSHEAMSVVVLSFKDMPGWFESSEPGGSPSEITKRHLSAISSHAAQLMEAEQLHGFCFIRKRWAELNLYFENSLIICAINPFKFPNHDRLSIIKNQLSEKCIEEFWDAPNSGFDSRIFQIADRTANECLADDCQSEIESSLWTHMINNSMEVVHSHNFAFQSTGIVREAYLGYLNNIYRLQKEGMYDEDISKIKTIENSNWLRAWVFMEGFSPSVEPEPDENDDSYFNKDIEDLYPGQTNPLQYCISCERFAAGRDALDLPRCYYHLDPNAEEELVPYKGIIPDDAVCFEEFCTNPPVKITGGQCFCEVHYDDAVSGARYFRKLSQTLIDG